MLRALSARLAVLVLASAWFAGGPAAAEGAGGRVAVQLSGGLRNFAKTGAPLWAKVVRSQPGGADVYASVVYDGAVESERAGLEKLRGFPELKALVAHDLSDREEVMNLTRRFKADHAGAWPYRRRQPGRRKGVVPFKIVSMWYGMKEANALRKASGESYAAVVRVRPDLKFVHPFDAVEKLEQAREGQRAKGRDFLGLLVPSIDSWGGLNDQLAIATPEAMDAYASVYDHAPEFFQAGEQLAPEPYLRKAVQKGGVGELDLVLSTRGTTPIRTKSKIRHATAYHHGWYLWRPPGWDKHHRAWV